MKNIGKVVRDFIEHNRQTGTTTALIDAVDRHGGFIVVGFQEEATRIKKEKPFLNGRVFTLQELNSDKWRGKTSGPVFFDTTAVIQLIPTLLDGYQAADVNADGYQPKYPVQFNMRLTKENKEEINWINDHFYEGEMSDSNIGRILVKKGIQWYKNLLK